MNGVHPSGMPSARYAYPLRGRFALTPVAYGGASAVLGFPQVEHLALEILPQRWTHILRLYIIRGDVCDSNENRYSLLLSY